MSVRTSLLTRVALSAGVMGAAAVSQAVYYGFAETDFLGGVSGHYKAGLNIDIGGTGTGFDSSGVGAAGFFSWKQTLTGAGGEFNLKGFGHALTETPGNPDDFYTICGQFVGINAAQDFNVYSSDHVGPPPPQPSTARGGAVAAYGFTHALMGSDAENRAAGFQIAVWTAVYGGGGAWAYTDNGPAGYSAGDEVTVGSFTAKSTHADWGTVLTYAEFYYNQGYHRSFAGVSYFLDSLHDQTGSNITGQDQYTVAVPEPFTMGIGLAGVAAYIRRRAKGGKRA